MLLSTALLTSLLTALLVVVGYFIVTYTTANSNRLSLKSGIVISVSKSPKHEFSKESVESITLIAGLGIEGDSHFGVDDQHLFRRVGPGPYGPNLRQVHLMHSELFEEFRIKDERGQRYEVQPADLGENVTTKGLDILGLGEGTRLHFLNPGDGRMEEEHAVVKVTGLRNPCWQISKFKKGLQERCIVRDGERKIVGRKAGIMSIVEVGGIVKKGARIVAETPEIYKALEQV